MIVLLKPGRAGMERKFTKPPSPTAWILNKTLSEELTAVPFSIQMMAKASLLLC
jgi:hypothetical protein